MCAVIGAIIKQPTERDLDMIRKVFFESKIRGMHATGMSYLPHWSDKVETVKMEGSSEKFIAQHLHHLDYLVNTDGNLYLIGHCRYSTSDLEFNQPMATDTKSIVHNGVLTQELPENWESLYGYKTETNNDSELILHSECPLSEFADMSMGVCELNVDKTLVAYRNGKRPLYLTSLPNGCIITSTVDIAKRAGITDPIMELPMNLRTTIDEYLAVNYERIEVNGVDYQHYEFH